MKDFDAATAVLDHDDEPFLETGPVFKPLLSKSTVLQATAAVEGYLQLPVGDELFECKFSSQANDLLVTLPDESEVLVLRYFSQSRVPSLVSEDGHFIHSETVETLAGVKPLGSLFHTAYEPVGNISALEGVAIIRREDGSKDSLTKGAAIFTGDILITDIASEVEITFRDGNAITLIDACMVSINRSSVGGQTVGYSVGLFKGSLDIATPSLEGMALEALSVHTPVASVYARPATRGHIHRHRDGYSFCLEAPQNELEGWMDIITRNGSRSLFQHTILMTVANFNDIPKQQTNLKLAVTQPTIMTYPTLANHISDEQVDEGGFEPENSQEIIKFESDLVKTNETVDGYDETNGGLIATVSEETEAPSAPITKTDRPMTQPSSIFTLNQLSGNSATDSEQKPAAPSVPPAGTMAPMPSGEGLPPLPSGLMPPPLPNIPTPVPPAPAAQEPAAPASFIPAAPPVAETIPQNRVPAFINDAEPIAPAAVPDARIETAVEEETTASSSAFVADAPAEAAAPAPVSEAETVEDMAMETAPVAITAREEAPLPETFPATPPVDMSNAFAALEARLNARFEEEAAEEAVKEPSPLSEMPAPAVATDVPPVETVNTAPLPELTVTVEEEQAASEAAANAIDTQALIASVPEAEPVAMQPAVSSETVALHTETRPVTQHTADVVLGAINNTAAEMRPAIPANEAREEEPAEEMEVADEAAMPEAAAISPEAELEQEIAAYAEPVETVDPAAEAPLVAADEVAEESPSADESDVPAPALDIAEPTVDALIESAPLVAEEDLVANAALEEIADLVPEATAESVPMESVEPTEVAYAEEPEAFTASAPEAPMEISNAAWALSEEAEAFVPDRMVDLEGFNHKRLGFTRTGETDADLEISLKDESGSTQHRIVFKQFFKHDAPKFEIRVSASPEE